MTKLLHFPKPLLGAQVLSAIFDGAERPELEKRFGPIIPAMLAAIREQQKALDRINRRRGIAA